ncbi:hypothetical protein ARMSODRAFT_1073628 [Armillaria solidipes]|uniref:Uncharacterized protein n=1 Tax=Armillaria solidipes TaxID=1076256 RepID=A0A2H3AZI9_9AGAR|nr:hypothetical protein ARMSODRAFT_1073628 [Armillaria solidipes]
MSRKCLYRCDLFGPEKLTLTDALEHALQELQSIFTKDNFKHISQELFDSESPDTLLLVLSCKSTSSSYLMICHPYILTALKLISWSFVDDKDLCPNPDITKQLRSLLRFCGTSTTRCIPSISKTQHHNKKDGLRRNLCGNHEGVARLWLHPVDGPILSLAFNHGFLHSTYMNIVEIVLNRQNMKAIGQFVELTSAISRANTHLPFLNHTTRTNYTTYPSLTMSWKPDQAGLMFWSIARHERYNLSKDYGEHEKQMDKMYERFPEVTLSALAEAGRDESSIAVPKQRSHTYKMPVITSALADTPCVDLGVIGVLEKLNTTLCTSYSLNSTLSSVLNSFIEKELDFGTAYAYLRPYWDGITTIEHKLCTREEEDRKRRQNATVDGKIVSENMPPRRIWDLFANRVVPYWVRVDKYEHYLA